MSRIDIFDDTQTIINKIAEGNPGAISTLVKLMTDYQSIDPQSAFGELSPAIGFDLYRIYGPSIYRLFTYKCESNTRKVIVLLRAVQLGIIPERKLQELADDCDNKVFIKQSDFESIDAQVCNRLFDFKKPE